MKGKIKHILYHLYYKESIDRLSALDHLLNDELVYLSINLNQDIDGVLELSEEIKLRYPTAIVIVTPNLGKDIGGKLALMDNYLTNEINSDYILLLHDKKSPQTLNGEKWDNDLKRITKKENLKEVFNLFEQNPTVGIVCSNGCISNEYNELTQDFNTTNNLILKSYKKQFNLNLKDFSFVAGTMFWVKSSIFVEFFTKYTPLNIRSGLEQGNVLDNIEGTKTHSLERVLSWLVTSRGYKIKEV